MKPSKDTFFDDTSPYTRNKKIAKRTGGEDRRESNSLSLATGRRTPRKVVLCSIDTTNRLWPSPEVCIASAQSFESYRPTEKRGTYQTQFAFEFDRKDLYSAPVDKKARPLQKTMRVTHRIEIERKWKKTHVTSPYQSPTPSYSNISFSVVYRL